MKQPQSFKLSMPLNYRKPKCLYKQPTRQTIRYEACVNDHDRSLEILLNRAYEGFLWLLERQRKYYQLNSIPRSEAFISVAEWRNKIAEVIHLNEAEIRVLENLLIQTRRLKYSDESQKVLVNLEQVEQIYMPDNDTGKAFTDWLEMPRE